MKVIAVISIMIFTISCSQIETGNKDNEELTKVDSSEIKADELIFEDTNLNILSHKFPDSDISYNVEITKVKFKEKKNAFEITKEKYSIPESISGLTMKVYFKMTNPYENKMRIPFPTYYFITSPQFSKSSGFIYSKMCKCYIDNTTKITSSKGVPLNKLAKRIDGKYMVDFNEFESKEFIISFTDNFPKYESIETITLGGFNKHLHKQIPAVDYYKMSEDEKAKSIADKSKVYSLDISIKNGEVVSKGEYTR